MAATLVSNIRWRRGRSSLLPISVVNTPGNLFAKFVRLTSQPNTTFRVCTPFYLLDVLHMLISPSRLSRPHEQPPRCQRPCLRTLFKTVYYVGRPYSPLQCLQQEQEGRRISRRSRRQLVFVMTTLERLFACFPPIISQVRFSQRGQRKHNSRKFQFLIIDSDISIPFSNL